MLCVQLHAKNHSMQDADFSNQYAVTEFRQEPLVNQLLNIAFRGGMSCAV